MNRETEAAHPRRVSPGSEPIVPPIYESSVYTFPSLEALDAAFEDSATAVYGRMGNPNARSLGEQIARMEDAQAGLVVASGQGAMLVGVLAALGEGGRVLYSPHLYGGTLALIRKWIARMAPVRTFDAWEGQVDVRLGDVLFVESLSNPLIRPTPISSLARMAHEAGASLVVDNTFATPAACRPITRGADVVAHSLTKALSGHGHVILGAVAGSRDVIARAATAASELGLAADPHAAWLAQEGSRTFHLRMAKAQASATLLARRLAEHPAVGGVHHPSLMDKRTIAEDFDGPGAVIAFDLGERSRASAFLAHLRLVALAPSLGDLTTTVSHPGRTSHRGLDEAEKAELGIGEGLIRLSVGIEDVEDIWADLSSALEASGA